jgi:hypothetical protein
VLTAVVAVTGVAYIAVVDPNEPGHFPVCPFYHLSGYYCPGCGSMRAIHALAHGGLAEALSHNPFTVLAVPYLFWAWFRWLQRGLTGKPRAWLAPPWVIWAVLVALIAFWVLRNLPGFSWLAP